MVYVSLNYDSDFHKVSIDRAMKDYELILKWSKIFLKNKSFSTFAGESASRALLFPMEKLFEGYVAKYIKRVFGDSSWTIQTQDKGYYLFDDPSNKFALKPDIVITRDDGYTANNAVNSLVKDLLISIVIIAILLIFTLGRKEAMIVSLMVPMILSLTLFIGFILGETINRITLFALIVSLGMLVDAAIIVIENIHRHKTESPNIDINILSINATNEIGNATNIATIAIIMTFIPMFFVGGMMGQFMYPLPVFVPISLAMSLFIAYAFTPYLVKKIL
ncbi:MAG: hypothetical protein EOM78_14560 [Erysipelotrichia bacterium]|nr:hypothetical protein [Erysipelotrichia bacterium]